MLKVRVDDLSTSLFIPDIAIGRLVETPEEIQTTISTYLSHDGILDLSMLDAATGHKVQVTRLRFFARLGGPHRQAVGKSSRGRGRHR